MRIPQSKVWLQLSSSGRAPAAARGHFADVWVPPPAALLAQRWFDEAAARLDWTEWLAEVMAASPRPETHGLSRLASIWMPVRVARRGARDTGPEGVTVVNGDTRDFVTHLADDAFAHPDIAIPDDRALALARETARRIGELDLHDPVTGHDLGRAAATVALARVGPASFPDDAARDWAERAHGGILTHLEERGFQVVRPEGRPAPDPVVRAASLTEITVAMLANVTRTAAAPNADIAEPSVGPVPSEADAARLVSDLVRDLDRLPYSEADADRGPLLRGMRKRHELTLDRQRDLVAEVQALLGSGLDRIAIVSDDVDPRLVRLLAGDDAERNVTVVDASGDTSRRHVELTSAGPFDVLIDLGGGVGRRGTLLDCFYHLRPGGWYVVPNGVNEFTRAHRTHGTAAGLVSNALAARESGATARLDYAKVGAEDRVTLGLARCLADTEVRGNLYCLRRENDQVRVKLREHEATELFAGHPEFEYRVIEAIEPEPFLPSAPYRTGRDEGETAEAEVITQPVLSLREYTDVIVAPGQVITDDRLLMPDTFRHNSHPRLLNRRLDDLAPRFAAPAFDPDSATHLPGTYFHLDNEVRGHFGHLLTEQVARMWAWPQVRELAPDARVIVGVHPVHRELHAYEFEIMAAAGIPRDAIELIEGPVRVDRVFSATQMFSNPYYVHPRIIETWDSVGDRLAATAQGGPRPERIFCSRKIHRRVCHNAPDVEALFAEHGFEILYPEDHPLGDQVEMFRTAQVVAGFAGSALFNLCFSREPTRVVMVGSESYRPRNEMLIAALRGHEVDAVLCASEGEHYLDDFTFDPDREGRYLRRILAGL